MQLAPTNLASLYLPLLTHHLPDVRQQACTILLATYGERSLTYLRRLLDDPDASVRQQALKALHTMTEVGNLHVELRPFHGIYVECLGKLRVYINGRELQPSDWSQTEGGRAGGRKVQGVFAYLVHAGRNGASRAELGNAIWGDTVSPASLARTISALRHVLAGSQRNLDAQVVSTSHDHYLLSPERYHTDAHLFERTFNMAVHTENADGLDAAVTLYRQALGLYNGPYMVEVPRAIDWGQEQRDLLMNDFVIAAERLAEHAYAQRQYQQCISLCRRALDADSTADDITCWLLRASAQLGLRVELEHTYDRYLTLSGLSAFDAKQSDDMVYLAYRDLTDPLRLPSDRNAAIAAENPLPLHR